MDPNDNILWTSLLVVGVSLVYRELRKKYRTRRFGVRPIYRNHRLQGSYNNLFKEMMLTDHESFHRFIRLTPEQFYSLADMVTPYLIKQDTQMRIAISAKERLALTLRYLASGDVQISKSFAFRVGRTSARRIIRETTHVLWKVLSPICLPGFKDIDWKNKSSEYHAKWNLPNCLGSIDGKRVVIECPAHSGSKCFNSIVLSAVCDADYIFTYVDIGADGSQSDGGIFRLSSFARILDSNQFPYPPPDILPNSNILFPHYFVGDKAFPLKTYLLRPYPGHGLQLSKRIFNYRLSHARRTIENAFGILSARWRIFRRPIRAARTTCVDIVKACVCLHNWVMLNNRAVYCPKGFVDSESNDGMYVPGEWHSYAINNQLLPYTFYGHGHNNDAVHMRDVMLNYLSNEGAVPWQDTHVTNAG